MIEFYFQRFADHPEVERPIRAAMARLAGNEVSAKHPSLRGAAELLANWDALVTTVLLPYADAVAALGRD